jgi:hypothetical protein
MTAACSAIWVATGSGTSASRAEQAAQVARLGGRFRRRFGGRGGFGSGGLGLDRRLGFRLFLFEETKHGCSRGGELHAYAR